MRCCCQFRRLLRKMISKAQLQLLCLRSAFASDLFRSIYCRFFSLSLIRPISSLCFLRKSHMFPWFTECFPLCFPHFSPCFSLVLSCFLLCFLRSLFTSPADQLLH